MDNEKLSFFDVVKQSSPFIVAFTLATWGGIVNYLQTLKVKKLKFSWKELLFDIITSSFAGLLTYFFCKWAGTDESISVVLIAISGHLGTRAIAKFEAIHGNFFKDNDK